MRPRRDQCSSPPSSSTSHSDTSLFYCAPTSAAVFSSSTPKHTLRKLMSHVNQARLEWPARRSDWGQSGSVIVVFNNDSSPYGATNCLPVVHNASQRTLLATSIRAHHTYAFVYLSFSPDVFHLVCNFAFRRRARLPSFPLLPRVMLYSRRYSSISLITVADVTSGLFGSAILYVSRFLRLILILYSASFS